MQQASAQYQLRRQAAAPPRTGEGAPVGLGSSAGGAFSGYGQSPPLHELLGAEDVALAGAATPQWLRSLETGDALMSPGTCALMDEALGYGLLDFTAAGPPI